MSGRRTGALSARSSRNSDGMRSSGRERDARRGFAGQGYGIGSDGDRKGRDDAGAAVRQLETRLETLQRKWIDRHAALQECVEQLEQKVEEKNKHVAFLTDQVEELSFRMKVIESQGATAPTATAQQASTITSTPAPTAAPSSTSDSRRAGSRRHIRRRHTAGHIDRHDSIGSADGLEGRTLSRRSSTRSNYNDDGLARPIVKTTRTGQSVSTLSAYGVDNHIIAPSDHQPREEDLRMPVEKVELERVYGYQGRRCRNNLHYVQSSQPQRRVPQIAYNVASLGIVLDTTSGKQRYYTGHNQEIRCLTVHPNEEVVASGQRSGMSRTSSAQVRIWSTASLETIRVLGEGGLGDAVTCLTFSTVEPDILASVHESEQGQQHLTVWNWRTGAAIAEAKTIHLEPIFTLAFNPRTHTLVAAGKHCLAFWTVEDASAMGVARATLTKRPALYQPHPRPKAVLAVIFAPNGQTITGDSNGSIVVWKRPVPTYNVDQRIEDAHPGGVYCLQATEFGFISGGRDNTIKLWTWDFEMFPVDNGEMNTVNIGACPRCISCVPTDDGPSLSQFVVGTTSNFIVFVDAGAGTVGRLVAGHSDDITCARCHPRKPALMLTVSTDGSVRAWDTATHSELWHRGGFLFEAENEEVPLSADIHPTTDDIAVGSSNGTLYVLDASGTVKLILCDAKSSVTCVSFSPSGRYFACGTKHAFVHVYTSAGYQLLFAVQSERDDPVSAIDWLLDESHLQVGCAVSTFYVSMQAQAAVEATETEITCDWYTRTCPLSWEAEGTRQSLTKGATLVTHCSRAPNGRLMVAGDNQGRVTIYKNPCYSTKASNLTRYLHSSPIGALAFESTSTCILSGGTTDACLMQWKVVPPSQEELRNSGKGVRSPSPAPTAITLYETYVQWKETRAGARPAETRQGNGAPATSSAGSGMKPPKDAVEGGGGRDGCIQPVSKDGTRTTLAQGEMVEGHNQR